MKQITIPTNPFQYYLRELKNTANFSFYHWFRNNTPNFVKANDYLSVEDWFNHTFTYIINDKNELQCKALSFEEKKRLTD